MPRSPPEFTLTSAVVIADRYHLKRQIAAGGMGTVWVAHDDKLSRDVAIKVLAKQLASHSDLLTRFEREAKAVAQLRSIHVVEVYDFGIHDRLPFIVMELLEGESLRSRLRRQGVFTLRETLIITEQIAKGLKAAHTAGLIHRDLKPSNVYLAQADDVEIIKLLDFGVVKAVDQSGSSDMTASGTLLGTPQYMSPEQVRARRRIDHRSDLWAFGVIVFRLLTGLNPFRGESVGDAALRICSDELPKLSDYSESLPAELDRFFARAFARDPAERFQTAEEFAGSFREQCAVLLSDVSLAAPAGPGAVPPRREGGRLGDGEAHGAVGPSVTPPSTSGVSAVPGSAGSDSNTPHSTRQPQMVAAGGAGGFAPAGPPMAPPGGARMGETPSGTPMPTSALAGDEPEPGPDTGLTKPYVVQTAGAAAPGQAAPPSTGGVLPTAVPGGGLGTNVGPNQPPAAAADALAIPGTSLPLPVGADGGTPVSTMLGMSPWKARLARLKRRASQPPMPLVLAGSGAVILLAALLFLLLTPGDAADPAAAANGSDVVTLERWAVAPGTPSPADGLVVEEQGGIVVEGEPDAGAEPAKPPSAASAEPPTVQPQPIKRGTTPPSPKPKDQRPKWF